MKTVWLPYAWDAVMYAITHMNATIWSDFRGHTKHKMYGPNDEISYKHENALIRECDAIA